MNHPTFVFRHLKWKQSNKFLLIFSLCILLIVGVVWACSYEMIYEDYAAVSSFSPEYFVAKKYSPFFYDQYAASYYRGEYNHYDDDNYKRYNDDIVDEWYNHLNHRYSKINLSFLLLQTDRSGVDSVYRLAMGKSGLAVKGLGKISARQDSAFFNYLLLAKSCEDFTVGYQNPWDTTAEKSVPDQLAAPLANDFRQSIDPFIKERLWFQLVRYWYFKETETKSSVVANSQTLAYFDKYQSAFPKNMIYYRTLGYVAGCYYHRKNYARANYFYSLCYDYSYKMKISSKWSFHPQNETDWKATLQLAKNKEEKITLWHLLGMQYDAERAIKEIVALDPKSDKLDLLLSRLVNSTEQVDFDIDFLRTTNARKRKKASEMRLVDSIAQSNNTAKPYFWNLSAGYLHYLSHDYNVAANFYRLAKQQMPAGEKPMAAQGRLLDILLFVDKLTKIDSLTESQLVSPLTWLANLRDEKEKVKYLRYDWALSQCKNKLATLYQKQQDLLKEVCLKDNPSFYLDSVRVERLKSLLNKPHKTAFEQTLVRYYPLKVEDLNYYQSIMLAYKGNLAKAIALMKTATGKNDAQLYSPFKIRLKDCYSCDNDAPQKDTLTMLVFLQLMKRIQDDVQNGKNVYANSLLLANAYYNITCYGNARIYQFSSITGLTSRNDDGNQLFLKRIGSSKLAEKYYLVAREHALTQEQKAMCTFMASKCEHNDYYTKRALESDKKGEHTADVLPPAGKYFEEMKSRYANTDYYKEVLQECGYFRYYVHP